MRPHIEPFCDRDVQFKNMRLPGFASGMRYKMLSFDPETGARNVRQRFVLQMFGETISGKSVASIPQSIQFNFFCGSP